MGWLFRSRRSNRRAPLSPPTNPPKPQPPLRSPISQGPRNEQSHCPLFSPNFPAELRIRIYEAVLGDHRLTHIIPFDDESNRVGRRRCTDPSCTGPTWQHKCFGTWLDKQNSSRKRVFTFNSSDQLLALPLSCHRMFVAIPTRPSRLTYNHCSYLEALDILYTSNTFSLKGSSGLCTFHSVTPHPQWHNSISRLHISTIFLTPQRYWPAHEFFPPDNYQQWTTSCALLQNLDNLRELRIEIFVQDTHERGDASAVEDEAIVSILEPLKGVRAGVFEVEMNIEVPVRVRERLGRMECRFGVGKWGFNRVLFPL